jgi:hypothetical protein
MNRRKFLKVLGAGTAGMAAVTSPLMHALADPPAAQNEFFIFIHASGGWDVMLWADPRTARTNLIDPPTQDYVNNTGVRFWPDSEQVMPTVTRGNFTFGAAIGDLADHYDKLCLINGLAMSTVSHPDGTAFSATGRHLAGGHPAASSINTMVANEFGVSASGSQLFPNVSISFPSAYVGQGLDPRVMPLRMNSVGVAGMSLSRSASYEPAATRSAVTAMLTQEAQSLASRSYYPDAYDAMALQFGSLQDMISSQLGATLFSEAYIKSKYTMGSSSPWPSVAFDYTDGLQGETAVLAAFAIEAIRLNKVRCVSFATVGGPRTTSLDTHTANYQGHALNQQAIFNILARMIEALGIVAHPTLTGHTLLEHTHIMVVSDFCRTPLINPSQGRDHHPNNSTLVISPKFKSNFSFGQTDDGLLPREIAFTDAVSGSAVAARQITPADTIATFLHAFGVTPTTKYVRDGVPIRELLV